MNEQSKRPIEVKAVPVPPVQKTGIRNMGMGFGTILPLVLIPLLGGMGTPNASPAFDPTLQQDGSSAPTQNNAQRVHKSPFDIRGLLGEITPLMPYPTQFGMQRMMRVMSFIDEIRQPVAIPEVTVQKKPDPISMLGIVSRLTRKSQLSQIQQTLQAVNGIRSLGNIPGGTQSILQTLGSLGSFGASMASPPAAGPVSPAAPISSAGASVLPNMSQMGDLLQEIRNTIGNMDEDKKKEFMKTASEITKRLRA